MKLNNCWSIKSHDKFDPFHVEFRGVNKSLGMGEITTLCREQRTIQIEQCNWGDNSKLQQKSPHRVGQGVGVKASIFDDAIFEHMSIPEPLSLKYLCEYVEATFAVSAAH